MKKSASGAIALIPLLLALGAIAFRADASKRPRNTPVHLDDNSDWWSARRASVWPTSVREEEPSKSAVTILGLPIWEISPAVVSSKIGVAPIVSRGDGDDSWEQVCHQSASRRVKFVFEQGGYEDLIRAFHLFIGGRGWNGSDRCVESPMVTENLAMPNGLRLGLTRSQVEAILGKPTSVDRGTLEYAYAWTEPPNQPDSIDDLVKIDARFTRSRVTYLAVVSFTGD